MLSSRKPAGPAATTPQINGLTGNETVTIALADGKKIELKLSDLAAFIAAQG